MSTAALFPETLERQAADLIALYQSRGSKLATAESCTGGLVAGILTEIAGSSSVVERGFVTYSNEAKAELLGVPLDTLNRFGAVSKETAEAMAAGALARSRADVAVSITGIAGPGGGTDLKPVGLVHFAVATPRVTFQAERRFGSLSRSAIRLASVAQALTMLADAVAAAKA